jgi:DNA-binding MarR family transcriptional regulator
VGTPFSQDSPRAKLAGDIISLLRIYSAHAQHISGAFAAQHQLGSPDLHALLAIMEADRAGQPLTAGNLAQELNFSTSSVTALLDRLEAAGHIYRARSADDRRKVFLHYAAPAAAVAMQFFAPLGQKSHTAMESFSTGELQTVQRFLAAMNEAMRDHRDAVRESKG